MSEFAGCIDQNTGADFFMERGCVCFFNNPEYKPWDKPWDKL